MQIKRVGIKKFKQILKKKSVKYLQKELDRVFSIYIRKKNIDKFGFVACITCGRQDHWIRMDCGHYISRKHLSIRWEEKNCSAQCKRCNLFNQGSADTFAIKLQQLYGQDILEKLYIQKHQSFKKTAFEYELLIKLYQQKTDELKS